MDRRAFGKMMATSLIGTQIESLPIQATSSTLYPVPPLDSVDIDPKPKEPLVIGNQKQLFVDRWIVEDTEEILFTAIPPEKHPSNPILIAEHPSDGQMIYPAGVRWNDQKKIFQLWYVAIHFGMKREKHLLAYAESDDGLIWRRPRLGVREFNGSSENNLVDGPAGMIIFDTHETNSSRRLKMVAGADGYPNIDIWFSADGIRWTPSGHNPVLTHTGDTHSLLGWDEQYKQYVGYFRSASQPGTYAHGQRRQIGISFSDNAESWTPIKTIIAADAHDPIGTEFYWLHAGLFENVYLGLLSVLHLDANLIDLNQTDPAGQEQTVDTQLVSSRDGVHWNRMGNRAPWLSLGPYQSWDDQVIWPCVPISFHDHIWIYYGGDSVRHTEDDLRNGAGKKLEGRTRLGGIGLAMLRRDGWVAARPNLHRKGVLTTRQFILEGSELELNVDASSGKVFVEFLSADARPLPGFSGADAPIITANSVRQRVRWQRPLTNLKGQAVRLRFTLENSDLYAFQFK